MGQTCSGERDREAYMAEQERLREEEQAARPVIVSKVAPEAKARNHIAHTQLVYSQQHLVASEGNTTDTSLAVSRRMSFLGGVDSAANSVRGMHHHSSDKPLMNISGTFSDASLIDKFYDVNVAHVIQRNQQLSQKLQKAQADGVDPSAMLEQERNSYRNSYNSLTLNNLAAPVPAWNGLQAIPYHSALGTSLPPIPFSSTLNPQVNADPLLGGGAMPAVDPLLSNPLRWKPKFSKAVTEITRSEAQAHLSPSEKIARKQARRQARMEKEEIHRRELEQFKAMRRGSVRSGVHPSMEGEPNLLRASSSGSASSAAGSGQAKSGSGAGNGVLNFSYSRDEPETDPYAPEPNHHDHQYEPSEHEEKFPVANRQKSQPREQSNGNNSMSYNNHYYNDTPLTPPPAPRRADQDYGDQDHGYNQAPPPQQQPQQQQRAQPSQSERDESALAHFFGSPKKAAAVAPEEPPPQSRGPPSPAHRPALAKPTSSADQGSGSGNMTYQQDNEPNSDFAAFMSYNGGSAGGSGSAGANGRGGGDDLARPSFKTSGPSHPTAHNHHPPVQQHFAASEPAQDSDLSLNRTPSKTQQQQQQHSYQPQSMHYGEIQEGSFEEDYEDPPSTSRTHMNDEDLFRD